jgi:hypothetical protein
MGRNIQVFFRLLLKSNILGTKNNQRNNEVQQMRLSRPPSLLLIIKMMDAAA